MACLQFHIFAELGETPGLSVSTVAWLTQLGNQQPFFENVQVPNVGIFAFGCLPHNYATNTVLSTFCGFV